MQKSVGEECRFDRLLRIMARECKLLRGSAKDGGAVLLEKSLSFVVDGLIFINALLDNLDDIEIRLHVRNQLYRRPFRSEFDLLSQIGDEAIERQRSAFLELLYADGEAFMVQYKRPASVFSNPTELFSLLLDSFEEGTEGRIALISILQHITAIRGEDGVRGRYIKLLDRTLEQVLLSNRGLDPDFASCPTPYFTTEEVERILNTSVSEQLRKERDSLANSLLVVQGEKEGLAEESERKVEELAARLSALEEKCTDLRLANSKLAQAANEANSRASELSLQLVCMQIDCTAP